MAEFEIPFSQMRFDVPASGEMVWGFQVQRDIYRRGEFDLWVGLPRGERGFVSRFGHLVFGDRLSPPRRVELLPYTFARREDLVTASAEHAVDAGLDLRLGLGPSATLSATLNPDFAQVELDPAVLNLTVFESFFPEQRPFFLEDIQTFRLPYGNFPIFHSRRIGRRPGRFSLEAGDRLVDQPDQTTIVGAVKVTGKASTWTYGALSALTSREHATVDAVVLALPPAMHARVARVCLDAGRPVLIEKPMASDLEQARDLVLAAESSGTLLMVAQTLRFDPVTETLDEAHRRLRVDSVCAFRPRRVRLRGAR